MIERGERFNEFLLKLPERSLARKLQAASEADTLREDRRDPRSLETRIDRARVMAAVSAPKYKAK